MIRRLTNVDELVAAQHLRDAVASSETTLPAGWIAQSAARVVAQESGSHLESDETVKVARAFAHSGATTIRAIVNDELTTSVEAYELDVVADDFAQISDILIGLNFVLVDSSASRCIVFSAYDFKLVAGPVEFVSAVVGDPQVARDAFLEFIEDQPAAMRATARRAAEYMTWIVDLA